MEDNRKPQEPSVSEDLEIVELDDRLDMAFDPMAVLLRIPTKPNTNCGNTQCCGGKLTL